MTTSKNFSKTVSTQEESMSIEGEYTVIVMKNSPRLAKSEKSMLLASTGGAKSVTIEGVDVQFNCNIYVPIKQWKAIAKKSNN